MNIKSNLKLLTLATVTLCVTLVCAIPANADDESFVPEITTDGHFRETNPEKLTEMVKKLAKTPDLPVDDMPVLLCRPNAEWTDQADDVSDDQGFEALFAMIAGPPLTENQKQEQKEQAAIAAEVLLDRNNGEGCSLRNVEISALNYYSIGYNDKLNRAIRANDTTVYTTFIRLLKSAMGKIKFHQGIVFRGTKVYPEDAHLYKAGTVAPPTKVFTSTSRIPSEARKFPDRLQVLLVRSCVDISIFSRYPNEKEILCPPGKIFKSLIHPTETDEEHPLPLYLLEEQT